MAVVGNANLILGRDETERYIKKCGRNVVE